MTGETTVELVIHVPDDFVEPVKDKLAAGPSGMLESVALDAVLDFLMKLGQKAPPQA